MSLKFCKIEGKTYVHIESASSQGSLVCLSNAERFYVDKNNFLSIKYYGEEYSDAWLGRNKYSLSDFLCEYAKFEQEYFYFRSSRHEDDLDSFLVEMVKHIEQIQKE